MLKQLSALVLTVAVCGSSWAEERDVLQPAGPRLGLVFGGKDMNSSAILGVGNSDDKSLNTSTLTRVNSQEDLRGDEDSDEEEGEKRARLSRQNSQENLKKAEQQSQGWRTSVGGFLRSVGNFFASAFSALKLKIWG
jgi:hypothetical protein